MVRAPGVVNVGVLNGRPLGLPQRTTVAGGTGVRGTLPRLTLHIGQGPLGRTARVLARSAHRSGVKITTPLQAPLRTSGTTAFLLAATRAPSPMAQALIMQQMLRMTRAFQDMHQANKELRETQLIVDAFQQHLAVVAEPLPDVQRDPKQGASHAGPTRHRGALREAQGPTIEHPYVDHTPHTDHGMEL